MRLMSSISLIIAFINSYSTLTPPVCIQAAQAQTFHESKSGFTKSGKSKEKR